MKRLRSLKSKDALSPKKPRKPRKTQDAEESKKQNPDVEKVYGCSRCRYAKLGCKTCKNPNFKPRRRRNDVEQGSKTSTKCSPNKTKKGSTGDDGNKVVPSRKKKTQPAEEPPAPTEASKPKIKRRPRGAKGGPVDVD